MNVHELVEKYKAEGKAKYFYLNNVFYDGREVVRHGYGSHYLTDRDSEHIKDYIVYDYRLVGYCKRVLSIDYMFEYNYLKYIADKETESAAYKQAKALNEIFEIEQAKLYKQYNMFGGMD